MCARVPQSRVQCTALHLAPALHATVAEPEESGLLPQAHQYRYICDLRKGATDSLVELEMTQHPRDAPREEERVPSDLPFYAIKAHMRELNVRSSGLMSAFA